VLVALRRAGVAENEVWIEQLWEPVPHPPEFLFLRHSRGGWETGVCERGDWQVLATSADESEACAHLLRLACP
jgi:hypothetical protein